MKKFKVNDEIKFDNEEYFTKLDMPLLKDEYRKNK